MRWKIKNGWSHATNSKKSCTDLDRRREYQRLKLNRESLSIVVLRLKQPWQTKHHPQVPFDVNGLLATAVASSCPRRRQHGDGGGASWIKVERYPRKVSFHMLLGRGKLVMNHVLSTELKRAHYLFVCKGRGDWRGGEVGRCRAR
jgi:hypothetical protein